MFIDNSKYLWYITLLLISYFDDKLILKVLFQAKKEPITDELSTVLDAKVTVTANFDVKVEGGKVPDEVRN